MSHWPRGRDVRRRRCSRHRAKTEMFAREFAPASADSPDLSNKAPTQEAPDKIVASSSDQAVGTGMDRERAEARLVRIFSSSSRDQNLLRRIERHVLPLRELPPLNSQVLLENLRLGGTRSKVTGVMRGWRQSGKSRFGFTRGPDSLLRWACDDLSHDREGCPPNPRVALRYV